MTTGFQQQHQNYGPIVKAVARPQHVGAKLIPAQEPAKRPAEQRASFTPSPLEI